MQLNSLYKINSPFSESISTGLIVLKEKVSRNCVLNAKSEYWNLCNRNWRHDNQYWRPGSTHIKCLGFYYEARDAAKILTNWTQMWSERPLRSLLLSYVNTQQTGGGKVNTPRSGNSQNTSWVFPRKCTCLSCLAIHNLAHAVTKSPVFTILTTLSCCNMI